MDKLDEMLAVYLVTDICSSFGTRSADSKESYVLENFGSCVGKLRGKSIVLEQFGSAGFLYRRCRKLC